MSKMENWMKFFNHYLVILMLGLFLTGCDLSTDDDDGGSSGSSGGDTSSTGTGSYVDDAVQGVSYSSGSQSGETNSSGGFVYDVGSSVTFTLGGITLRTVSSSDLVDGGTVVETNSTVGAFLQSLDEDGNPDNGIVISSATATAVTNTGWDGLTTDGSGNVLGTTGGITDSTTLTQTFSLTSEVNTTVAEENIKSTIAALEESNTTFVNSSEVNTTKDLSVLSISPDANETNVSTSTDINITFNLETSSTSGIYLFQSSDFNESDVNVSSSISFSSSFPSSTIARIAPSSALSNDTNYTILVSTDFSSTSGKKLENNSTNFMFQTASASDDSNSTAASVVFGTFTDPTTNETNVPITTDLNVTWDKNISSTLANFASNITVTAFGDSTNQITSCSSYDEANFVVTCALNDLNASDTYDVSVGSFTDTNGVSSNTASWQFQTAATTDTTAPSISSTTPERNTTTSSDVFTLLITFDDVMDTSTLIDANLDIDGNDSTTNTCSGYSGTFSITQQSIQCANIDLANDVNYSFTLNNLTDDAGNALSSSANSFFLITPTEPDTTNPTITFQNPTSGATSVARNTNIIMEFDEEMNSTSVSTSNMTLAVDSNDTTVSGTVQYIFASGVANYAVFNPGSTLDAGVTYKFTVQDLTDTSGNTQSNNPRQITFTTAGTSDTVQPTVSSVSPSDGSTVSKNTNIEVTFSEEMDESTITDTSNWTISPSVSFASSDIEYNDAMNKAVLDLDSNLSEGQTYTVTLSNGIQDIAGNELDISSGNNTWQFTILSSDAVSPTVVDRSPDSSENNVSTGGTIVVEFSEEMNPDDMNTSNILLIGSQPGDTGSDLITSSSQIYYSDKFLVITPGSDLNTSTEYNVSISGDVRDLAGNSIGNDENWTFYTAESVPSATNLTVSATDPSSSATSVGVDSNITVQFDDNVSVSSVTIANFTMEETSNSNNDISGVFSFSSTDANVTFNPDGNLSYATSYTVTIAANGVTDEDGNALASDYTFSFTTESAPTETVAPTVEWVFPANNDVNVTTNITQIWARFSEEMNTSNITSSDNNFSVMRNSGELNLTASSITWIDNKTVFFNLKSTEFTNGNDYNVSIKAGVTDANGNALANDYNWSFSTAETSIFDTTSPEVNTSAIYPSIGGTNVPINSIVNIVFDEDMACSTVTSSTIYLEANGAEENSSVTCYGRTAIVQRNVEGDTNLTENTVYTVFFDTNASNTPTDVSGNAIIAPTWTFTTGTNFVGTDFNVSSRSPDTNESNVSLSSNVKISFSNDVLVTSVTTDTIFLYDETWTAVSGDIAQESSTVYVFDPSATLENNMTYTVGVLSGSSGVKDVYGNTLSSDDNWTFETLSLDVTGPTVSQALIDGWIDINSTVYQYVSQYPVFAFVFNEDLNSSTIATENESNATIILTYESNETNVTGTHTYDSETFTITFEPSQELNVSAEMNITVTTGITDDSGNALDSNQTFRFKTAD